MSGRDIITARPGKKTELVWDDAGRQVHLVTTEDVTALLDDNVRMQNAGPGWLSPKKEFRLVARLNMTTVMELMKNGIWYDRRRLRAWLNDADHRKLRTDTCRL